MPTAWPAGRIGSMAPSMKSTGGTEGGGWLVPPQDSARAARAALVTAVLATHKADGLRQAVGQAGEFGRTSREIFNGSELFGCGCRHPFSFPAGRGGAGPRLLERLHPAGPPLGAGARHP